MSACISLVPYGFLAHTGKTSCAFIVTGLQRKTGNVLKRPAIDPSIIYMNLKVLYFFSMAQQPLGGLDLLIIEASRSHSDTLHSVGLLWTSDQSNAGTSTWQHTTLTTDRHPCPRRDSNPQSQQASGRRLKVLWHITSSQALAYFCRNCYLFTHGIQSYLFTHGIQSYLFTHGIQSYLFTHGIQST
jgi:hypothetical protein